MVIYSNAPNGNGRPTTSKRPTLTHTSALSISAEGEVKRLLERNEDPKKQLVLPAYDFVIKAAHAFNLLDARGALSVTERQRFILRVRNIARKVCAAWLNQRQTLGFPLLKGTDAPATLNQASV